MASSAAPEVVPELAPPVEEGTNDNDHETPKESTTEPRKSNRTRAAPELYGNPVINFMVDENLDPATYEEAMMSPDSNKWLEAMNPIWNPCMKIKFGTWWKCRTIERLGR